MNVAKSVGRIFRIVNDRVIGIVARSGGRILGNKEISNADKVIDIVNGLAGIVDGVTITWRNINSAVRKLGGPKRFVKLRTQHQSVVERIRCVSSGVFCHSVPLGTIVY